MTKGDRRREKKNPTNQRGWAIRTLTSRSVMLHGEWRVPKENPPEIQARGKLIFQKFPGQRI
jgi:hypothetical protein